MERATTLAVLGTLLLVVGVCVGGLIAGLTAVGLTVGVGPESNDLERFEQEVDQRIAAGEVTLAFDPDDPLLASRRIVVTTEINELTSQHVVSRLLYLDAVDPGAEIDLFLRTAGGYAYHSAAVVDTMALIRSPVNTWAIGQCGSAATEILAAGTGTRTAGPSSIIVVHLLGYDESARPYSDDAANAARDREFWEEHASLPEEWLSAGEGSYALRPEQAVELGVVDRVAEGAGEGPRRTPPG